MGTILDGNVIHVDFDVDERPKYVVLESAIRAAIARGDMAPGTRLPAVRDLAWRVGVTPGTVARAYSRLTDSGVLDAAVGRGTFVAEIANPAPIYREFQALEVNSTPHGTGGYGAAVNLLSPHLPSVGQSALIGKLLGEIAKEPPSGFMHYPAHAAEAPARAAAREFLASDTLGPLEADDIALTNGGQHAINLVMQSVLSGRRPVVLVEDLTYPGFRRVAEMLRAEVIAVETDAHGPIPASLDAAARNPDAQLFCTSPDVQNPTLAITSADRRDEIVEIARARGLQILEDDCYLMGPATLPSYRVLAPERTWHVSSIAKVITPALRLGFAMAPPAQRMTLRRACEYSSFGLSTPIGDLAARLLVDPDLPALMEETRQGVTTYVRAAARILAGHDLTWRDDVSFMWLMLPDGWRASAFARAAERAGIKLRTAEEYTTRDGNPPHAVRFAINTGIPLARFEEAMSRLRGLLDNPQDGLGV